MLLTLTKRFLFYYFLKCPCSFPLTQFRNEQRKGLGLMEGLCLVFVYVCVCVCVGPCYFLARPYSCCLNRLCCLFVTFTYENLHPEIIRSGHAKRH